MNSMHISRIDLNLLVVLDTICTEGSITKASEKLNLTQSAISHALTRLRVLFEDPLFVREGRAITPTPLARSLIEPIGRSLRGIEVTLRQAGRFDPATSRRHFTVAVRGLLELTLLPPLLARIAQSAPGVDIAAVRIGRRDFEQELAMATIDAAIDMLLPLSRNIRRAQIGAGPMVVVVRRGHPGVGDDLDLESYMTLDHILVSSRRYGPGPEDVELIRRDLHRRIRLRCQDYFTACRVVSQTDLILTMPALLAHSMNQSFGNRIVPVPFSVPMLEAHVYWHASADCDPANCWLRERIIEAFSADPVA